MLQLYLDSDSQTMELSWVSAIFRYINTRLNGNYLPSSQSVNN